MLLPPYTLPEVLRALRFFSGLRQEQLARRLGMSQGWLSKFEMGIGDLNAQHLMALRENFQVPCDAFLDGQIPYLEIAERFQNHPRLPLRFRATETSNTRLRIVYGFLRLVEERLGREQALKVVENLRLPVELLAEANFPVHPRLLLAVVSQLRELSLLDSARDWREAGRYNFSPLALGETWERRAPSANPTDLFRRFLNLHSLFTRDIQYSIVEKHPEGLSIRARATGAFLDDEAFTDGKLLQGYSRAVLQAALQGLRAGDARVAVNSELSHAGQKPTSPRPEECRFYVRWS